MKTVSGRVLSTKPISLSKAASILSNFVSAETGASQAVRAYLRRTSISFHELSQLHKELKPNRKQRTPKSKTATGYENPTRSAILSQQPSQRELTQEMSRGTGSDFGGESEKKKNKKKRSEIENLEESKGETGIEEDGNLGIENERKKKQKKHRKEKEISGDEIANSKEEGDVGIENERKKGKKKKEKSKSGSEIGSFEENGDGIGNEEKGTMKKKKKKRKSREIEDGIETNSEDLHSKKKKKRKTEGQS
ncbi:hypothetical protein Ddye_024984 [Dipteronia dyeriana]|uniref:Uncharacterized protein n=1 Tax=Dipteronia dyeriana TaxID=168575 RepID=A0AAD9TWE8_9ROSI|nr:hypothetical protein Ddye_024984 [Dipteronia dyeriana]